MLRSLFLEMVYITNDDETRFQFYQWRKMLSVSQAMRLVNAANGRLPALVDGGRVVIAKDKLSSGHPLDLLMATFLAKMEQILATSSTDDRSIAIYDLVKKMCGFKYFADQFKQIVADDVHVFNNLSKPEDNTAYIHLCRAVVWLCIAYGYDAYFPGDPWFRPHPTSPLYRPHGPQRQVDCTMEFLFTDDSECACTDELKKEAKTFKRRDPLLKILAFIDRCCCAKKCKSRKSLHFRMRKDEPRAEFVKLYDKTASQRKMLGLIHTDLRLEPCNMVYVSSSDSDDTDDDKASVVYVASSDDEDSDKASAGTKRKLPGDAA